MFDKEEKALKELGESIINTPVPDSIDAYIKKGIQAGKAKKKSQRKKHYINAAVIAVFALFLVSIRVSPVFAAYVSKVPGLSYIVQLVNYDKGIKEAVNNDFVQHINLQEEHEGIVFTIKDIIIDKYRAVIFYSIENKTNHKFVDISEINFKDENGKKLEYSHSRVFINKDLSVEKIAEGTLNLTFSEGIVIPEKIFISVKLSDNESNNSPIEKDNVLSSLWQFKVPIDKNKFEKLTRTYEINKTAVVENQKITFKRMVVTPIRIALDIEYDKDNTKKILSFDDLVIMNEKGEKWGNIINDFGGSYTDNYHTILYFQSNYFTNPKEIYITGSRIKALDKDKLQVIVDLEHSKIIKTPDDRLTLTSVIKEEQGTKLEFNIINDKVLDKQYTYSIFNSTFLNEKGKAYDLKNMSCSGDGEKNTVEFLIPKEAGSKEVTLTIYDYPVRIKEDFKVRVK